MLWHGPNFYMKYIDALQYIEEVTKIKGSVLGLDNIKELCRRIGNPQDSLRFVHIAGTNGKGSTLGFISTILKESGYKTGRYISPTIRDYRERFQVNGTMISQSAFAGYIELIKPVCEEMVAEGLPHPTAFEIETAIAFKYFADKKCDIVVLETGLGGIEDATNIITTTVLSVIVSISMDHMQFLGNTLTEIAEKKCGIIKPGVPVISTIQKQEALEVIEAASKEKNSGLTIIHKEDISRIKYGLTRQSFYIDKEKYEIALAGVWQIENAALAVRAAHILRDVCGYKKITEDKIKTGLHNTKWHARFQVLSKRPLFIIDGAHNEDAAKRLRETIDTYFADKNKFYIMGMFRDKEVEKVVETISVDGEMVLTCQAPNNPRALSAVELAQIVSSVNPRVTCCDSVEEAVEFATSMAGKEDVIIACGSLAYLGKIMDIFDIK